MESTDALIRWCRREEFNLRQQLGLLEAGKMSLYEDHGSGMADTTLRTTEAARKKLAELEIILTRLGAE